MCVCLWVLNMCLNHLHNRHLKIYTFYKDIFTVFFLLQNCTYDHKLNAEFIYKRKILSKSLNFGNMVHYIQHKRLQLQLLFCIFFSYRCSKIHRLPITWYIQIHGLHICPYGDLLWIGLTTRGRAKIKKLICTTVQIVLTYNVTDNTCLMAFMCLQTIKDVWGFVSGKALNTARHPPTCVCAIIQKHMKVISLVFEEITRV